jgi:oxygen-independent coproporphyrinogen-3 oxidase
MSAFGLYIHVPYCKTICPYCDFNVVRNRGEGTSQWADYFGALQKEWTSRRILMSGPLRTLYFGGGTPSLAPPQLLRKFIESLKDTVEFQPDIEITLEADPGTVNLEALQAFKEAGVNRLSLGWQSTDNRLLKVIGRQHSAQDNLLIFEQARQAGFENLSVDFMFALPGQTMDGLKGQLEEVIGLGPEHISLYALTYHDGTPFEDWRKSGKLIPIGDDTEARMMNQIESRLEAAGYEHYEVSNYAKSGFRSKHNQAYWTGIPYLGIGSGANSFLRDGSNKGTRFESIRNPKDYVAYWGSACGASASLVESSEWVEELTPVQLVREQLMVGLRTRDGVYLQQFEDPILESVIYPGMNQAIAHQWVVRDGDWLRPTSLGLQFADSLGALFF